MLFARVATATFGLGALAIGGAALTEEFRQGRSPALSPFLLGALALLGIVVLFLGLLDARRRARTLQASTTEFRSLAEKLEASLATVSAMNARLNESEVRFKGLVDAQGDAIFRRSPDSNLTYANDAFFKLFRLSPQQAVGQPFAPELHPDSRAPLFGSFAGLETGRARVRYDQHVRTAYGWRWIAWEDYAIRNSSGRLVEIQSVGRDITERKALEEALTEARDRAEAASRAKSGFLATMSHEIRTPMNGVLGMARLLMESKLDLEQRTYAEAIQQSGAALLSLIEDILDFSKIESGTLTLEDDETDPRQIVEGVAELLAPRGHAKGIELVAVIAPDAPELIRIDSIRLRQVLTNLVGNAVKFTDKGGVCVELKLEAARERTFLRFEVRDTGVGVPVNKREDIFNEFVQADSSHARRFGGSGLGLAISKRLVASMGGEIGVESAPGGGSTFWFTVPAIAIREADPRERERLKDYRIAFVTRNAMLWEGVSAQIRAAGGEVVSLSAANGQGKSAATDVDAILIDAGTSSRPEPTAQPANGVRSIVLLAPDARGKLADLKSLGFDAYLVKPIRQTSLAERIRAESARAGSEASPPATPEQATTGTQAPRAKPIVRPLKILLAEDNPINALLTRELLRRRGHDVTEVASGDAAVTAMDQKTFDLVLTDIHMPRLDGIEAARQIRARERSDNRRRTPIVALTADVLETGRWACHEAGMDGFLAKPIDPSELDAMFAELFPVKHEAKTRDAAA